MNLEIIAQIRRFVADECCNFFRNGPDGIHNHCWGRPKTGFVCYYFLDKPKKCPYFEESVLPINPELEGNYENRGTSVGESTSSVIKGIKGNDAKVSASRTSLDKFGREGILSGK